MERHKATPEAITSHRLCICLYVYTDELPGLPDLCEVTTASLFVWIVCTIDNGCAVCLCVCVCVCVCVVVALHTGKLTAFVNRSLCVFKWTLPKKKKKNLILILARVLVCIRVCVSQQHM